MRSCSLKIEENDVITGRSIGVADGLGQRAIAAVGGIDDRESCGLRRNGAEKKGPREGRE